MSRLLLCLGALLLTACLCRHPSTVEVHEGTACPTGYHFLMADQGHRDILCQRDSAVSR